MNTTATLSLPKHQPWLFSPLADSAFILSPALLVSIIVLLCHPFFERFQHVSPWAWVILILGVDVAHVYSTLFRTYFKSDVLKRRDILLTITPVACWLVGILLYSIDGLLFWRCLAYLAVFHFVRQQYGFMAIYARNDNAFFQSYRWLDTTLIYISMVYPLLWWHTHLPRQFHWFIDQDFFSIVPVVISPIAGLIFLLIAVAYMVKELVGFMRYRELNLPKNLVILGTALSWNMGIVLFNNDLIFTATNVLSHGIPYMALVWLLGRKEQANTLISRQPAWQSVLFSWAGIPLFLGLLWLFAYVEESVWDALIWKEHGEVFSWLGHLSQVLDTATLAWLVPLLALPQAVHYVLDGFIWRTQDRPFDMPND